MCVVQDLTEVTMTSIDNTNSKVLSLVSDHLNNESQRFRYKKLQYSILGLSSLLILATVGFGMGAVGYSYFIDKSQAATEIGHAISQAIGSTPIQAHVEGKVTTQQGSKVTLAEGAEISLSANQKVTLDPSSKISIENPKINAPLRPSENQLGNEQSDGLEQITTTYTIFTREGFANGSVESAWTYNLNDTSTPISQACSYITDGKSGQSSQIIISRNNTPVSLKNEARSFDMFGAIQKCRWADTYS